MTKVTIWQEKDEHHIKIEGHAGYGEAGNDIVCAGISTLAYTMINELTNLEKHGVMSSYQLTDGKIHIIFSGDEKIFEPVESVIITGFEMISENFPDNLTLTRGENKNKIC